MRTPADWQEAALDVIASEGVAAVSVPRVAAALSVTKGSFYWHFAALDELTTTAVERWRDADAAALAELRKIGDAAERLRALFRQAMSEERPQKLLVALTLSPSPQVLDVLRQVTASRIRLLADTYEELGLSRADARRHALFTYSAYVGAVNLRNAASPLLRRPAGVTAFVEHAERVLIGATPASASRTLR